MLTAVADEVFDSEGEEEEEEEEPSCTLDEINEERIWWENKIPAGLIRALGEDGPLTSAGRLCDVVYVV